MSATILSGDWTVYYEADNRQKRIEYTGTSTTNTANELYSALQDHFDTLTQMDDGTPMSAQTPKAYTIGIIDTGDDDPWFIDNTSAEHITGGAIKTASWTRATGTNTGIVRVEYTEGGTVLQASDIGETITLTGDGDTGTILDYNTTGSTKYMFIRPTTSAAANDWDGSGACTVSNSSANPSITASSNTSGEKLWSNIFTIGTIASNTHIYVEQDGTLLTAAKDTTDWWSDGHIDVNILTKEVGVEVDEGYVTVFARQLTKTYSYFESDLSAGGATAIPLGTGTDLNAAEGVRQMVLTDVSGGDITVGYTILDDTDSTIEGVVTSVSGTGASQTIQYYLIGDPLTDFSAGTGVFSVYDTTGTDTSINATAVAPSDVNSGAISGPAITFTADSTVDVDENDTPEDYSIIIDASDESVENVYQWAQWLTRRGGTTTANTDGIQGQFYRGIDYVLVYTGTVTGLITEGNTVTQETSGATATVVAHDTTNKLITLRNSRGTFGVHATTATLTDDTTAGTVEIDSSATAVSPNAASPFGTYAGGIWFLATGVALDPTTLLAADAQNYRSITNSGTTVTPPNKVTVEVTNLRADDRVSIHRLTASGGIIEKDTYAATVQAIGDATLVVGTSIDGDEPGKSTGGVVVLVGTDEATEYPIRYSSWSSSTFTLANQTGTADDTGGTTSTTNLHQSGKSFTTTVKVGDLVLNTTQSNAISYVTAIVDDDNLTISPAITGQASGDAYEINAIPIITDTSDDVYVPLLYRYESTGTDGSSGSESTTLVHSTDIPVLVRVRNAQNTASTTTPMIPYAAEVSIISTGLSNAAIRTKDNISSAA